MRSFSRLEYASIEIVNSIVAIFSLYLSIQLLDLIYIISFLVVQVIKTVLLIIVIKSSYNLESAALIMDTLCLGFVNSFRFNGGYISDSLVNFSSFKNILFILLNAIYLFGVGILEKSGIDSWIIYSFYSLMLFQLLFFGIIVILYCMDNANLPKINLFVNSLTINLTLLCMMQNKDNLGINLGYYYLVIYGIASIIVFLMKWLQKYTILGDFCFFIFINVIKHDCSIPESILIGIGFISQIIRFVLLAVYAFPLLDQLGKPSITEYEVTKQISCLLVICFTVLYFYNSIIVFIWSLLGNKKFSIWNRKDYQRLKHYLGEKHKYLLQIEISLHLKNYKDGNITESLSTLMIGNDDNNNIFYEIYKAISDYKKENPNTFIFIYLGDTKIQNPQYIAAEIEILHYSLIKGIDKNDFNQIIANRLHNNYIINNEGTNHLIDLVKAEQTYLIHRTFITQTLSIFLFYKMVSNELTFSQSQILYDLFES